MVGYNLGVRFRALKPTALAPRTTIPTPTLTPNAALLTAPLLTAPTLAPRVMVPMPAPAPVVDPCTGLICPTGTHCDGGVCVGPCTGVICPTGTHCDGGVCLPDAPVVLAPTPTPVTPAPLPTFRPAQTDLLSRSAIFAPPGVPSDQAIAMQLQRDRARADAVSAAAEAAAQRRAQEADRRAAENAASAATAVRAAAASSTPPTPSEPAIPGFTPVEEPVTATHAQPTEAGVVAAPAGSGLAKLAIGVFLVKVLFFS